MTVWATPVPHYLAGQTYRESGLGRTQRTTGAEPGTDDVLSREGARAPARRNSLGSIPTAAEVEAKQVGALIDRVMPVPALIPGFESKVPEVPAGGGRGDQASRFGGVDPCRLTWSLSGALVQDQWLEFAPTSPQRRNSFVSEPSAVAGNPFEIFKGPDSNNDALLPNTFYSAGAAYQVNERPVVIEEEADDIFGKTSALPVQGRCQPAVPALPVHAMLSF
jgi:hypothetical protein